MNLYIEIRKAKRPVGLTADTTEVIYRSDPLSEEELGDYLKQYPRESIVSVHTFEVTAVPIDWILNHLGNRKAVT